MVCVCVNGIKFRLNKFCKLSEKILLLFTILYSLVLPNQGFTTREAEAHWAVDHRAGARSGGLPESSAPVSKKYKRGNYLRRRHICACCVYR